MIRRSLLPSLAALLLLVAGKAEAQVARRIHEAAARAAEREAMRQAERAAERLVRCAVTDEACVQEAKRRGRPVEIVTPGGNVPAAGTTAPQPGVSGGRTPASLVAPEPGPVDSALARSARGADGWNASGGGRLTDGVLPLLVAILEAEIRDNDQWIQQRLGTYTGPRLWHAFERDRAGLDARTVDPLAWIEAHARRVPVPPGTTYVSGCSRYLTRLAMRGAPAQPAFVGLPQPVPVVAVFTFNRASPAADVILANPNDPDAVYRAYRENPQSMQSKDGGAAWKRAQATFRTNGLRTADPAATVWVSANHARDALRIVLSENAIVMKATPDASGATFDAASDDANSCRRLPSGEVFVVRLHGLPGEVPVSHREAMPSRLRVASHTLTALFQSAYRIATYLSDPARSGLAGLEERDDGDTGLSAEELATHRHNLAWYRRHGARLAPLFARYAEQGREREQAARASLIGTPR